MTQRFFTLEEAREAIPAVRELLLAAQSELECLADDLVHANSTCQRLEREMVAAGYHDGLPAAAASRSAWEETAAPLVNLYEDGPDDEMLIAFGAQRIETADHRLRACIQNLSSLQENYLKRLNFWIDRISSAGIILRDLKSGLVDFPARQGELEYYLCWKLNEPDISHWHLPDDGLIGRKPLSVLVEYF